MPPTNVISEEELSECLHFEELNAAFMSKKKGFSSLRLGQSVMIRIKGSNKYISPCLIG